MSAAAIDPERTAYDELCLYTLGLRDAAFIHQHVVDAFIVQRADESTKPIGLTFGLLGLYLRVERGYTGRQIQQVHMLLGRRKREWPRFAWPKERGAMTAADVMTAPPGPERDRAIDAWCAAVWAPWRGSREMLAGLLEGRAGRLATPGFLCGPSKRPVRSHGATAHGGPSPQPAEKRPAG